MDIDIKIDQQPFLQHINYGLIIFTLLSFGCYSSRKSYKREIKAVRVLKDAGGEKLQLFRATLVPTIADCADHADHA